MLGLLLVMSAFSGDVGVKNLGVLIFSLPRHLQTASSEFALYSSKKDGDALPSFISIWSALGISSLQAMSLQAAGVFCTM